MNDGTVVLTKLASIGGDTRSEESRRHGLIRIHPLASAGHYDRRAPVALDTRELLPSEINYAQFMSTTVQEHGPLRRYVLRDAVVTGQGSVLTAGGALLEESCWEFLIHRQVPYGLERETETVFHRTLAPSVRVDRPSLLLKRPWWRNYGHFLIDAAALLAFLARRPMDGIEQIVVGAPESVKLRAVMRDALERIGTRLPVVEQPDEAMWAFSELHYVEPVRRPPLCTLPEAVEALRVAVLGRSHPEGGRRLFVSRRNYDRRQLANEAEIIALCERRGFELVYPEQLSLSEQASQFASASAVAGVKGAGLTNILFSPPDAVLFALSPGDFSDPFFWDIASARGLGYAEIFGRLAGTDRGTAQNAFVIDPQRLDAMLRDHLPERQTPMTPVSKHPAPLGAAPMPPITTPVGTTAQASGPRELEGDFYQACLARIHARTRPRTYLEIGTLNGQTLALSKARSVAVDPAFQIEQAIPGAMPTLFLYQGRSDAFFETCDPVALLGGPIDLAFLDGMHLFEFLLRDFINTERHCHPGSVVILHDCLPPELGMTRRDRATVPSTDERYRGWWTGDVWKTVDILMHVRPDLDLFALDAPPTGLVVIRNLDPASAVLSEQYPALIREYAERPDQPAFEDYWQRLPLRGTASVGSLPPFQPAALAAHTG